MNSSGESSVSYLCPQCQTKLSAQVEDAGQRRECPHCGKMVKVPGVAGTKSGSPGKSQPPSKPTSETGGIANIPVVCPLCGTRMYAAKSQIGQSMVCPDCLESVVVPDLSPPAPSPRPVADPESTPPGPPVDEPPPSSEPPEDPDEYKLGDEVELPRHRSLSGGIAKLMDQHILDPEDVGADVIPPPAPKTPTPDEPESFSIKCPVCDTMMQVTADQIGAETDCPDCYTKVQVKRPPPKPRRVSKVVESDYKDNDYILGAPAELEVFRPTDKEVAPRTVGEEALRKAREAQVERERETPVLPVAPLFSGLFDFLPDPILIARMVMTGILIGASFKLLAKVSVLLASGDAGDWFFAVLGGIVLVLLGTVTISFSAINFLTVLQESAEGGARITDWPENSLAEWITESFTLLMALFFAAIPGLVMFLSSDFTGLPLNVAWILVGASIYMCFPVAQLSILESASLTNPASRAIIASVRGEFMLWATFYIVTFFLSLGVAIVLSMLRVEHSIIIFIVMGLLFSFAAFLYFRLIGRLAWACQMRPLQDPKARGKSEESDPSNGSATDDRPSDTGEH